MRRKCRQRFPRHRRQEKPRVSDPGKHHDTCVTAICQEAHLVYCVDIDIFAICAYKVQGYCRIYVCHQGPLLLTSFNFNPSMDK